MTAWAIDHCLTRSARPGTINDLWAAWRMEEITIALPGMAAFAGSPSLGNKLRGALGNTLLGSASQAVRDRKPCDWSHTSTAELFFGRRPLIRLGDHDSEITPPFVFSHYGHGSGELIVRLIIFGEACGRTAAIADALVFALGNTVKWHKLAKDGPRFIPKPIVPDSVVVTQPALSEMSAEKDAGFSIVFLTPIDGERGDAQNEPALVVERLARRIALVAPWHGVSLQRTFQSLLDELRSVPVQGVEPTSVVSPVVGGHRITNRLSPPLRLRFRSESPWFRKVIAMGAHTHVGRGASLGLGRYRIEQ